MIMQITEIVNQYLIKHEFIKRLHRRYGREGIEIPFPIRTIQSMDSPNGNGGGPSTEISGKEGGSSSN